MLPVSGPGIHIDDPKIDKTGLPVVTLHPNGMKRLIKTLIISVICLLCLLHPLQGQITAIRDIQYTADPGGNSPLLGQTVSVSGTVTAVFEAGFVISDSAGAWNSVYVVTGWKSPELYQCVELSGTVFENQGMTTITSLSAYTLLAGTTPLEATWVNAAGLASEQYESVLIATGPSKVISYEGNGEWMIEDSSGTVLFDDLNDYVYFPQPGDSLDSLKGIVFYASGNFKIEPRFTNDFSCAAIPHYSLRGDVVTMNEGFDVLADTYLEILGDQIIGISGTAPAGIPSVNVQGFIFPGFIDAHNHPHWNVQDIMPFDRLFQNRYEWRNSLLYSDVKDQHNNIINYGGNNQQYTNASKLAELRGLCAGTTTIQGSGDSDANHQGILINNAERFPARIVSEVNPLDYPLAAWQYLSNQNWKRFVIHLCEGTDQLSFNEFETWKDLGMLDERTTIIHGTALTQQAFAEMAAANAKLVWSPKSNWLLYGATADIPAALAAGVNVSLAPDWTLSGERDILREMKFADRINQAAWAGLITPQQFASFVTRNAALALGLEKRCGTIAVGYQADLTVIPLLDADPYESLMKAEAKDIALSIVNGRPMLGNFSLMAQFPFLNNLESITVDGETKSIGIQVASPVIPESGKSLAAVESEIQAAFQAAGPKACRFLNYALADDDPWEFMETGILSDLCAIHAISGDVVWASGLNATVIRTNDGGNTWDVMSEGLDSLHYPVLEAIDASTVLVAGYAPAGANPAVKIFKTANGGQNWSNVYSSPGGKIHNITMFDAFRGIAVGDPLNGEWTILKTEDGGAGWVQMPGAPLQSGSETGYPGSVCWEDSLKGWFGSSESRIYHTADGGETWTVINQTTGIVHVQHLAHSGSGMLLIAGDGLLARSVDDGASWQVIPKPGYASLDFIRYHDGILWAADAGTGLSFSNDNGDSWQLSSITLYRLADVSFIGALPYGIWVAGYAGAIFHSDQNASGITDNFSTSPAILIQNYPNPFRHTTTIGFLLQESALVHIELFDMLGQKVGTLLEQVLPPGSHSIDFNPSGLACGVYMCRLKAGDVHCTREMILLH